MTIYTCPMHPEIRQPMPGTCPLCGGMKLVPADTLSSTSHDHHHESEQSTWKSYLPLIVIISLLLITTLTITIRDISLGTFSLSQSISYFMIGFFLTFAGFKLMDLPGFAEGYATYDLLAQKWPTYGYIYPFIELFFGLAMIVYMDTSALLWAEFLVMVFSGLGVTRKLLRHEQFKCACLGTFLKVPLTKITLVEDFGMALLAGILLWVR